MICINSVNVYPNSATITKGQWYYDAWAGISSNCPECAEVRWYSSNTSIASVNETTGYIYGVNTGTTRVYAQATDGSGISDYITVTVIAPIPVTGVAVCPAHKTMDVGEMDYLCETVYPSNATNQTVIWCSSNESVATVGTYTGFVRAKKAGTVTITATTVDGGYQDCMTIYVRKNKIYQTKNTYRYNCDGCLPEDLEYDDISENDLKAMDWINWSDFVFTTPAKFRSLWEDMATTLFSTEPLQTVVLDMIEHFMSGDGSNYSNSTLTEKVLEHESTQNYITAVKNCIAQLLCQYNGDIRVLTYTAGNRDNNPLVKLMQTNKIYQPVYNTVSDKINGLTICIDGLWGNQIEVKEYNKTGNSYSGTLVFTLYDHFGLDAADVEKYGFLAGFKSWYILQHNEEYNGEYKPFVTVINFEVPFSGTI